MGHALERGLIKIFGEKGGISKLNFIKTSLHVSINEFKPTLMHHLILQPALRGGFNATIFMFGRITSLLLFTPVYIWAYRKAKLKFDFTKRPTEFAFGFAYGLVSCIVYNFLFTRIYDNHMRDTALDLEFDIFKETDVEEGSR